MTQSGNPWTSSGMKKLNKPHEKQVRNFLTALCQDPQNHAKFLNMLSMLEHMGSRKIMVSHMDKPGIITEDMLKHLAEETRHAYFFKRQAERIAKHEMVGYTNQNTMQRIPALMYFGRIDAGISKKIPADKAYGWVSLIIELRACWLYAIYHKILQKNGVTISLKSLLAEEDMHLAEMFEMCGDDTEKLREFTSYETQLFGKLWETMESELKFQLAA